MRYELKSIGFWSFTKVAFFINLVLGFIIGLFYAMFFGLMISMSSSMFMSDELGVDPAEMSIGVLFILLPILFAVLMAFFQTFLMVLLVVLYNLLVKIVGGLEFNLELVGESKISAVSIPKAVQPMAAKIEAQPVVETVRPSVSPPTTPSEPSQVIENSPAPISTLPEIDQSEANNLDSPKIADHESKAPDNTTPESDDPKL